MVQTKTFNSEKELNDWLAKQGDTIKVINISTTKRGWSATTGFLGSGKMVYTVVYEIKS